MKLFLGITGASGQVYGGRLLKALLDTGNEVTACFSDGAVAVIRAEELTGEAPPGEEAASEEAAAREIAAGSRESIINAFLKKHGVPAEKLVLSDPADMGSAFASGSSLAGAAIICPCSMNTLASVASGITRNLIHRTADVLLKERRPLVVVPRETPLSQIHLGHMLELSRAGASIVPAMPAFYHRPKSIDDLVDFVAGKVLDVLGIEHELFRRWGG